MIHSWLNLGMPNRRYGGIQIFDGVEGQCTNTRTRVAQESIVHCAKYR